MNKDIVNQARDIMRRQTKKNGAPAWVLTEIAVAKGLELSKKYKVDKNLISTSLYFAHTKFSQKIHGSVQKNHERLSANFAKANLKKWKLPEKEIDIVMNAILSHHNKQKTTSLEAEVMKNAECFKFLTVPGAVAFIHHLGNRGLSLNEAVLFAKSKAVQKLSYITLKDIKIEAKRNFKEVLSVLNAINEA